MKLRVKSIAQKEAYTVGRLEMLQGGEWVRICDTLEDKVRDLTKEAKVAGQTAIPAGVYKVSLDIVSPKYSKVDFYVKNCNGGRVPRLLDVPGFSGILVHAGNTAADTAGCILVGENKIRGQVVNSKNTFLRVHALMREAYLAGDPITIEIVRL